MPPSSVWQRLAPALLAAGLMTALGSLDVQQGLWAPSEAYARGPSSGGGGEAGSGSRGDGVGGRGGAGENAVSATDSGAGAGRDGVGGQGFGNFSHRGTVAKAGRDTAREQALAVARERYNRALGAPTQLSAKASAGPGQESDTVEAVFVFSEKTTEALIQAGWAVPRARAHRMDVRHSQRQGEDLLRDRDRARLFRKSGGAAGEFR
jgi:hypothetical protein